MTSRVHLDRRVVRQSRSAQLIFFRPSSSNWPFRLKVIVHLFLGVDVVQPNGSGVARRGERLLQSERTGDEEQTRRGRRDAP